MTQNQTEIEICIVQNCLPKSEGYILLLYKPPLVNLKTISNDVLKFSVTSSTYGSEV